MENFKIKGKETVWLEMDELIQKFDADQIKLLLNPKNKPASHFQRRKNNGRSGYNYMGFSNNQPRHYNNNQAVEEYFTMGYAHTNRSTGHGRVPWHKKNDTY